ncbi:MAG: GNAT family N-acetyltransferase [Candidatus Eisenbacteria bacterium]|uniref:Aminoglycoside N(6')-acetyltransferase type 1 n=1 Tax=Eiseniibacteriota bacterium TaxID=2212470 RepID=A0A7Y2H2C1_UNCEI|nr:GNAT family N-acetyltransferase [Candidatus Eisenbacteria bacterium]
MLIRLVEGQDTESWSHMRTALWPETVDQHRSEIAEYFAGNSIDIVQAYVAVEGAEVVGFLELNLRNFAEGSRSPKLPYVEAWYVKPAFQGRGYGKQLMKFAEEWALSEGYVEIASDTEIDNVTSIAMHKHLGFVETERVVCFLKKLSVD